MLEAGPVVFLVPVLLAEEVEDGHEPAIFSNAALTIIGKRGGDSLPELLKREGIRQDDGTVLSGVLPVTRAVRVQDPRDGSKTIDDARVGLLE